MAKVPSTNPKNLLKIGQAAEIAGVSIDTLRRWEKKGWIETVKTPGGTRFYTLDSLKAINPNIEFPQKETEESSEVEEAGHSPLPQDLNSSNSYRKEENFNPEPVKLSDKLLNLKPDTDKFIYTTKDLFTNKDKALSKHSVYLTIALTITTSALLLTSLLTTGLLASYSFKPNQTASFFSTKDSLLSSTLSPFNRLALNILNLVNPTKSTEVAEVINQAQTQSALKTLAVDTTSSFSGDVLAESSPSGKFLEINTDTRINGALSATTLDTGFGANELYPMNQPLRDSDGVTFATGSLGSLSLTGSSNQIKIGNLTITSGTTSTVTATIPTLTANDSFAFSNNTQTFTNKSLSGSSNTFTNIPNSALSNSKVTVSAGSGLSGGGDVSLGSSVTLTSTLGTTVDLTSEVTGVLPTANGGTAISSYTTGDILYASATNTLSKLNIGTSNQVLTVSAGVPTWVTGSSSTCPTCVVTDPASTQTITPSAATATGLSVAQASSGSVDIFNVTSNGGGTKYFKVDSSGNVDIAQSLNLGSGNINLLTGAGAPASGTGSDGDYYFRSDGTTGNTSVYYKVSGAWISAGGGSLQNAYTVGNSITTTTGSDIAFVLADVASATKFSLTQQDPAGTSAFYLDNANASGTNTNGISVEQTGAGTLTNGINITRTAGTLTNGLAFTGTFTNLISATNFSVTNAGLVTTADDLALNGGDLTTTSATFNLANAATTLNLGSTNVTRTINIGTGTSADTINIGTGGTTAETIIIGTTTASNSLSLNDDNWNITGAGLANFVSIGAATAGTGAFTTLTTTSTINSNTFSSTALTFASTAPTISVSTAATGISLEAGTTGVITIGGTSTGGVNIAGSGTGDINLGGGSGSTGCTVTNSTGALACSGNITGSSSGTVGFW